MACGPAQKEGDKKIGIKNVPNNFATSLKYNTRVTRQSVPILWLVNSKPIPYQRTVFVCTNVREDGRLACANPGQGGDKICEKLKAHIKEAGFKGKVRVARSGCLDLCAQGPNLFVYPDNLWYSHVKEEDLPELIKRIARGEG